MNDEELSRLLGSLRTEEGRRSLVGALEAKAASLEESRDYPKAAGIWISLNDKKGVERCIHACEKKRRYSEAADICEMGGQYIRAADNLERAGLYSRAAYIHETRLKDRNTAQALRKASDMIYGDGSA
ncbi:MAG: hypothetical protein KGH98_02760 [Candidatus Micrarchaeota archaeon]|nr:hypothetical protein [Candidatus Micrarchaeota archaeon]